MRQERYDLGWRRRHLPALILACLLAAGPLGLRAVGRTRGVGRVIPVDPERLERVRERIDPNTASVASLRRLPGIGPVIAQAIVAYRKAHGPAPFRRPEDLQRVPGIGPRIAARIAPDLDSGPSPGKTSSP